MQNSKCNANIYVLLNDRINLSFEEAYFVLNIRVGGYINDSILSMIWPYS